MSACVLDTDVVIAALDRADAHHPAAVAAFGRLAAAEAELLICTVNYAEVLVRPPRRSPTCPGRSTRSPALGIRTLAPDAALARDAARHRALGISLADGFALATAGRSRADLATFDKRVRRALASVDLRLSPELDG